MIENRVIKTAMSIIGIMVLLAFTGMATAQDDVISASYGETYTVTLPEEGQQRFLQFTGQAGEVVYVAGKSQETGSTGLLFEIRDSVGRQIGIVEDFPSSPYALAELPADGAYTAVVTADRSSDDPYTITLDQTGYLGQEPQAASFEVLGPAVVFGVKVPADGEYALRLARVDAGDLPVEMDVEDFTRDSGLTIIRFSGQEVEGLRLEINLKADTLYIVRVQSGLNSIAFLPDGADLRSEFTLTLVPNA